MSLLAETVMKLLLPVSLHKHLVVSEGGVRGITFCHVILCLLWLESLSVVSCGVLLYCTQVPQDLTNTLASVPVFSPATSSSRKQQAAAAAADDVADVKLDAVFTFPQCHIR